MASRTLDRDADQLPRSPRSPCTMSPLLALTLCLLFSGQPSLLHQDSGDPKELIGQLKDKDEAVRLKAVKELAKLKEKAKDALPALNASSILDEDQDVRAIAKRAIETIQEALDQTDKKGKRAQLELLIRDLKGRNAQKK